MTKRTSVLLAVWLMSGCARCSSSSVAVSEVVDAGPRRLAAPSRSIDFRTTILNVYPEYRDTAVLETSATVTRTYDVLTDQTRDTALEAMHYAPAPDGGWVMSSFHLSQPSPRSLAVTIEWDADQLGHLYVAPTGITSMELALYLPRELPPTSERVDFLVRYASSPERSAALIRQAVTLLRTNHQWTLEGNEPASVDAGLASEERFTLKGANTAVITFERTGGRVFARYALDTR